MSDPKPIVLKVHTLRDNGQWYFSGPFCTHTRAELFAIGQGENPDVLAVLIGPWEDEEKDRRAAFDEIMKAFREGGHG